MTETTEQKLQVIKLILTYYDTLQTHQYTKEQLLKLSVEQLMRELTRVREESSKEGR